MSADPECRPTRNAGRPGMPADPECRPTRNAGRPGMPADPECRPTRNAGRPGMPGDPTNRAARAHKKGIDRRRPEVSEVRRATPRKHEHPNRQNHARTNRAVNVVSRHRPQCPSSRGQHRRVADADNLQHNDRRLAVSERESPVSSVSQHAGGSARSTASQQPAAAGASRPHERSAIAEMEGGRGGGGKGRGGIRTHEITDLQSVPLVHLGTRPSLQLCLTAGAMPRYEGPEPGSTGSGLFRSVQAASQGRKPVLPGP